MSSEKDSSTLDNDINPAKRVKLDPTNESVLQMFVESAFEKNEIKDLGNWLNSQGIDVNNPAWYSSFLWNREVEDENANGEDSFKVRATSELKNILPFLLNCNDDVSFTDMYGQTILHLYIANSESDYLNSQINSKSKILDIVKSLIGKGASVNVVDKQGRTPLHIAAESRKFEILKLMLDSFTNVDACDMRGSTILHSILERNSDMSLDIVKILLGKGADPNKKNEEGLTPLHLAVCSYNVDMLQIFKENGADFNVRTDDDETPLLLAYRYCYFRIPEAEMLKVVNYLVDQGCDVNVQNKDGYSPAHYAVKWKITLKRLVELGADVNYQTKIKHKTPLHLAVDMERWDCDTVRTLYRAGADFDALDFEGRTPLDVALESDDTEMAERILYFGGKVNKNILGKCYKYLTLATQYGLVMLAIGLSDGGKYKTDGNRKCWDFCLQEAEKMKVLTISEGVSLYEFLHMDFKRQIDYVDCLPRDLDVKFRFYGNFVMRMRNKALRRDKLWQAAKKAWCRVTNVNFPDICVERIFHFLSNWNLKILIDVAEMSENDAECDVGMLPQEENKRWNSFFSKIFSFEGLD